MPTIEQILKVLKNERECIKNNHDYCYEDCDESCPYHVSEKDKLEVYDFLINGYELLQNEGAKSYTIKCKEPLSEDQKANLLGLLGTCTEKATFVIDDLEPFKIPDNMRIIGKGDTD